MDHALVVPLLSAEEAQDVDRAAIRMASGRLMAACSIARSFEHAHKTLD